MIRHVLMTARAIRPCDLGALLMRIVTARAILVSRLLMQIGHGGLFMTCRTIGWRNRTHRVLGAF